MNRDTLKKAGELAEGCGRAIGLFAAGEIAMGEGDIAGCQKAVKEGQALMRTMCGDIFPEIREALGGGGGKTPCGMPSNLELIARLSDALSALGSLIAEEAENGSAAAIALYRKKTVAAVDAAEEIYRALYEN